MKHMVFLLTSAMMVLVSQSRAQSPIPTDSLQLWLRADAGVDTLNGTVSRWHDQSGKGNDAIQATVSRQPLLVASALNGNPVLRFDGINDKLGFTGTTQWTQFSLFLIINNHRGFAETYDGHVVTFGANGDFEHQWFMWMRYPGGSDSIAMATGFESDINAFLPNVAAYDQWRNLSIVTTGSVWTTTLRWDGLAAHMSPVGVDHAILVPLGDAAGSGGGIGGADGVPAGTILAKCDVAEVIVYNVAVSDSVRTSVKNYLAGKYRLLTGVNEHREGSLAQTYILQQNYPNPFNPVTKIGFQVAGNGWVTLKVYDVLGREVRTLVNEEMKAGTYETTFSAEGGSLPAGRHGASGGDAGGLASGVYLYRLVAGGFSVEKKLVLLR